MKIKYFALVHGPKIILKIKRKNILQKGIRRKIISSEPRVQLYVILLIIQWAHDFYKKVFQKYSDKVN